ncbi:MAG: guanylate kinase [Clostridiales bacterium]|nr:guanylate kinase [Clostridiales bacterium]
MGKIFIIIGKSATGKDTIYKMLLKNSQLKLKTCVTYTTRPIRKSESNGVEYFFVDEAELRRLQSENKIIEQRSYNTVHGVWHYFTVNDGQIKLEVANYLMLGTLESFMQIRKYYGEDKVIPIYLEVDNDLRLLRAIKREQKQENPNYSEVCRRYLADEEDFSEENLKKAGITKRFSNNNLKQCLKEIVKELKNYTVNP